MRCRESTAPLLSEIWIYCGKTWAPNTRLQNLYFLLQNQLICTKHVYENQIARAADFAVVAGFAPRFGQSKQWQGREIEIYNLYGWMDGNTNR